MPVHCTRYCTASCNFYAPKDESSGTTKCDRATNRNRKLAGWLSKFAGCVSVDAALSSVYRDDGSVGGVADDEGEGGKVEKDGGSDVLDGGGYPLIRERAGGRDQHRGLVNWVNINLLGLSAPTTLFTS
ncbi:hypothetical protein KQX54_010462 [Cotesia glomerata]|uniref:Uncharacterized protein n=1 Tax=Cotesia glomerata TaxID=32391 RepID=A0AAV7J581_COTGL|nr:hypothetical protein KQX54_010462 [Cotesia glomerata]